MNIIKKINFDDEGVYDITYLCNGEEIGFEDYIRIENALEENNDNCDGDCSDCEFAGYEEDKPKQEIKLTPEEQYECDIFSDFTDRILESQGCPRCIFDAIMDIYYIGKEDGYDDCEEDMMEFLDR
jgi:hypothetical protein